MGNRGIQLSVFFIISLMLLATVFSNTVMAAENDGKGRVTVGWSLGATGANAVRALAADGLPTDGVATDSNSETLGAGVATSADPLAAGSARNVLQFTYTAFTDVAGNAADG
ncbi:hypothetical protein J4G02_12110, partial [Candidatus Poribacteria bacterium]|nr:hypothetical protein [Candidatus Poribacteria bacterium]